MAGTNITEKDDPLRKVTPEYLYHAVKEPKTELAGKLRLLRQVRTLDRERYSQLKRRLPYIVCGNFSPPIRKREHFGRIRHFILDIDHLSEKERSLSELREQLRSDARILMAFASPGEDGLKLLFSLQEYCYDAVKYTAFYKQFATAFAQQHGLDQVLDRSTCDVTRACFISMDPDAWYNEQAEPVILENFINFNDTFTVAQTIREIKKETTEQKQTAATAPRQNLEADVFAAIRSKLNPTARQPRQKNIFVPQELEDILERVTAKLEAFGIAVSEIQNISYGKKFRLLYNGSQGEINLFFGKKGFTVVESPKHGVNTEFNSLAARVIQEAVYHIN